MPTEREKQIEDAARKDRAEQAKAVLAEAVDVLARSQHFTEPARERALGELAKFVQAHHGILEAHQTAIIDGQNLMLRLMEALTKHQDDARKLDEKLAGIVGAVYPQGFGR